MRISNARNNDKASRAIHLPGGSPWLLAIKENRKTNDDDYHDDVVWEERYDARRLAMQSVREDDAVVVEWTAAQSGEP